MQLFAICNSRRTFTHRISKILLIMWLTTFLLIVVLLQARAEGFSQQRVTLSEKNASLKKVLKDIHKQVGIDFLYSNRVLDQAKKVTIEVKNVSWKEVFKQCMKDQQLIYNIVGDMVIIKVRTPEVQQLPVTAALSPPVRVAGQVTDSSTHKPMAGVTILVKGGSGGTTTNGNGQFNIAVPDDAVLVFSYLGYTRVEIPVNGQTIINVEMGSSISSLNRLVIVGYGTQKKSSLTGSIASISNQQLKTTTTPNLSNMLAGKLPGLRVKQRSGTPGGYYNSYDIRGMGSPLIIVDGVPSNDFNRIDPNDVASISVLKDASAAVYGVRAANGVILVTTKRGKEGQMQIHYTGTVGGSAPTIFPHGLNAYQFATLTDEADMNSGAQPTFSQAQLQQYKDGTLKGTDWFGLLARTWAPQVQNSLTVSGGTEKVKYFFSVGSYIDDGIWKSGSLNDKKYNFRSNITAQITDNISVQMLVSGIQETTKSPWGSSQGLLNQPLLIPPTIPAYANGNPDYLQDTKVNPSNPVALTRSSLVGYNHVTSKELTGTIAINYTPSFITGLKAKLLYSYDPSSNFQKQWRKKYPLYTYDSVTSAYSPIYRQAPSTLYESYNEGYNSDVQASLDYERFFDGGHNLKVLLLFEQARQEQNINNFNGSKEFALDAVDQLYAGNDENQQINSSVSSPFIDQGIVGRLNYDYKNKYLVEGSFRYDGSSKFAKGRRWGFFPNISVGWRLSEEPFIKNSSSAITSLKIRASWGKLGDDAASTYQFMSGYTYPSGNYVLDNTVVAGLASRGMANPDITWFTATTTDIGIDGEMWNGKLTFTADVFRRERTGLLAQRNLSLPATVGASLPQENLNGDLTEGFELETGHTGHIGTLHYNLSGNISFTRTKNRYMERAPSPNPYDNWRNNTSYRWNDVVWGYKVVGQFSSQEDVNSWAIEDRKGNRTIMPGDFKYEDYNKDGVIDDNDMQVIGRNPEIPEVNYGFTMAFNWKGFDLNILLQGAWGYYVNQHADVFGTALPYKRNGLLTEFMDRWHHADIFDLTSPWVPGKYPTTTYTGLGNSGNTVNNLPSTFWWHNDPYLRLKSVELGYTLPGSLTHKVARDVRIFANGFNILTWSKVKYIDPEHPTNTSYPILKRFNVGISVTF